eukprot:TRINITY_DN6322_c0_g1_i1.p1 TRINITY_DN6322_c0_g1~~TRINITY_DN6322_c0_g1_i1.p1  ORF type:complete len:302 (+),score=114.83 TRINITY_DN6322_c0_g1_i1:28-906(+)
MRAVCVVLAVLAAATVFVQCSAFDDAPFEHFKRSVLADNTTNTTDPVTPTNTTDPAAPSPEDDSKSAYSYSWEELLVLGLVFLVVVVFGIVFAFFGYRFFKKLVALFGAVFGFVFGYFFTTYIITGLFNQEGSWVFWVALGVGVLLLIVGALVAFKFYIVSVFLVGAATGIFIGYALWVIAWSAFPDPWADIAGWAGMILLAVIGGFLAIWINRVVIMFGTALIGSFFIVIPIMGAIELVVQIWVDGTSWFGYITIPLALLLSIGAFVFQYRTVHMDDFDNEFREKDKLLYG